ncbi:MAG: gliding motility-associated C-terminal domain-containing protein [Bacteroidota bacterium]
MHLKRYLFILGIIFVSGMHVNAQLNLTTSSKINTKCDGFGCEYYGPSILINEVMIHPSSGDGSIYGQGQGSGAQAGEWIELYNPDLCKSVDISCYFLGNNSPDGNGSSTYGGGFELPAGTIVPPRGFCVVRGENAPAIPSNLLVQNGGNTVEVIITAGNSVCIGGGWRLWFPNAGGWFAFYNRFGVPQDAISWHTNTSAGGTPCNPVGNCPFTGTLPSYTNIPAIRKNYIYANDPPIGQSIRRLPDGGNWVINQGGTATYGTCNAACAPAPIITCNGMAIVNVSGGVPPYTYIWDDGQAQTNDSAVGLCDGTYCVTVQDANGLAATTCVVVQDFAPAVSAAPSLPAMCQYESPIQLPPGTPTGGAYSGPGVTGNQFDPGAAGPGTHILNYTIYNSDSCHNSAPTSVLVFSIPPLVFNPVPPVCLNSPPITLTQGSPLGGYYTGPGISGTGTFSAGTTGLGAFVITYHYSSAGGCTDSATATVVVNSGPTVTFSTLPGVCLNGSPVTLTGGSPGGGVYTGTGVVGGKFYPVLSGVGTFTLNYAYSDQNNCSDNTNQTIQVYGLPVVNFTSVPSHCRNDSSFVLIGGSPTGGTYTGIGVFNGFFDPEISGQGIFSITYTFTDAHGCTNDSTQKLTVLPIPYVQLGSLSGICIDNPAIILSNGTPVGGTYTGIGVSGTTFDPSVSGIGDFIIKYSYTDANGCTADTTSIQKVNPLPTVFNVSGGGYYCLGADPLSIDLSGSESGVTYMVYIDGHPSSITGIGTGSALSFSPVQDSGVYVIHAINTTTGCKSDMTGSASVFKIYMPKIQIGDTMYFCDASGIKLDAGDFQDTLVYLWSDGSSGRYFTVMEPGVYNVKVFKEQCYSEDSILVEACSELWMPNIFTPNGDNYNPRFLSKIIAGEILTYSIEIYNRWGKMVYQSEDLKEGWDGSLFNRGNDCPDGVYFYIVKYIGASFPFPHVQHQLTGEVTLMR